MSGPNPRSVSPICFLNNIIRSPNIIIGDYTYGDPNFENNVLFHSNIDQLIIGKFCSIAMGVTCIMNAANHNVKAFSTFPFGACQGWEIGLKGMGNGNKGDTIIGNDVWIGRCATIMPGVIIGDGAIIGANSTVTKEVKPYTIVGGNPAVIIRERFNEEVVNLLLQLKWWDWDIDDITKSIPVLCSNDVKQLKNLQKNTAHFFKQKVEINSY